MGLTRRRRWVGQGGDGGAGDAGGAEEEEREGGRARARAAAPRGMRRVHVDAVRRGEEGRKRRRERLTDWCDAASGRGGEGASKPRCITHRWWVRGEGLVCTLCTLVLCWARERLESLEEGRRRAGSGGLLCNSVTARL
eukprot:1426673-Rhodomonas_salina.1